ncbi:DUF3349 domain-containing protein [Mycobacterium parmense]|uniref:Uncharacterized protein n=1 Tax=Mycobacterium parmense TaxID=185642 RepID=A0A7I7YUF7_9MYCO|nr:DUF3349 domain-containing protein [Mycobacterium parmense]MCV7351201.1 DUF3349 domain-containing protein [Mycobacterium parmense]ORW60744.1 hypothetical protein AWC20_07260 [Mycobacterium parmense]BBZ45349.1 hypothetical protein MPRM_26300 [Mycobacterium parmense]
MGLRALVASIVAFFRAGYPAGAPALGYVPLLALLPRRVSDDEIPTVIGRLAAGNHPSIDSADVGVAITRVTHELPSADDIERVERRMAALGWTGDSRA